GACTGAVSPGPETCNAEDYNCDGHVDEGCSCVDGTAQPCGSSVGACKPGTQTCASGAWGACTGGVGASTEQCDGVVDDNCNGVVDEGCACANGALEVCGSSVGACKPGTRTCANGAWGGCTGAVSPATETC